MMQSLIYSLLVGVCVLFSFGLFLVQFSESLVSSTTIFVKRPTTQHHRYDDLLSLRPGELPGYTGWSRPEFTTAPYYDLIEYTDRIQAGDVFQAEISCFHKSCRHGGAHFYVRLYGPAVITGIVKDHLNGSYTTKSWPLDPGRYTVEVVLAFSYAPDWSEFPLADDWAEPDYEGYVLPDFPLEILVGGAVHLPGKQEICSLEELTESVDDQSARIRDSRWRVVDKINHPDHKIVANVTNGTKRVSLRGYQENINSLGICMDYISYSCSFLPWPGSYHDGSKNCLLSGSSKDWRQIHIIFVGDSVMELQKDVFDSRIAKGSVKTTLVTTCHGIVRTYSDVTAHLTAIAGTNPSERRFVLFNTGLHDISQLCNHKWADRRQEFMNVSDDRFFSCTAEYRRQLTRLVDFISNYPAEFRVFQTTTAGWPKYGNFGFAWPPQESQPFPSSPNFVSHLNEIAFDVIRQHNTHTRQSNSTIHVMDGYWITLSRPDNREVNSENFIGKHMVHPGKEVLRSMVRLWWMILLHGLQSDCVSNKETT